MRVAYLPQLLGFDKMRHRLAVFGFGFVFFSLLLSAQAQQVPGKYVIGTVLDKTTQKPVDKATVVNKRTGQRARTNAAGRFFLTLLPGDSITLSSQTYNRTAIRYDGSENPTLITTALPPLPYRVIELDEVTVTGKRYEQVKREIQQVLDEPVASQKVTGEQAFDRVADGAGVTLLYELFAKRPKTDRKAYYIMQQDRRHALAVERFRLLVEQATTLTTDKIDDFREYCDFDDDFLLKSADYDLINAIQQLLVRYQQNPNRFNGIQADPEAKRKN